MNTYDYRGFQLPNYVAEPTEPENRHPVVPCFECASPMVARQEFPMRGAIFLCLSCDNEAVLRVGREIAAQSACHHE
jgi:hypothetical protein